MLINFLILLVSLVPSVLIVLWMTRRKNDPLYKKSCHSAILRGAISVLPILALSGTLFLLNGAIRLTLLKDVDVLLYKAVYTFVVLAFAEELIKFLAFRLLLKKKFCAYSWADVTALMVIIGAMFGLMEDLPYAIDSNAITMLVRGFTAGHIGYGFLMGWFYGKRLYTGKKRYGVISFLLPWLIHGLYDFSLTPQLLERNDSFAIIAVLLALADLVLLTLTILFFARASKRERYSMPIAEIEPAVSE